MEQADSWVGHATPAIRLGGSEEFAEKLTIGKQAAPGQVGYERLFVDELEGGVASFGEEVQNAISAASYVARMQPIGPLTPDQIGSIARLVSTAHLAGSLGSELPTLQVASKYHAAVRFDKSRRYKKGDWLDALHAAAAVPYCHILFTESSLRHLLTTKPVSVDVQFGCKIISDLDEMIEVLIVEQGT